jgi:RHS repeat-associated protein
MLSVANGTAPSGTVVDGGAAGSIGGGIAPYATLLDKSGETGTAPKAYLNFIVFDKDFNPILGQCGYIRLTEIAKENGTDVPHERLTRSEPLIIAQPGFVYIYLSNENETPVEVFFDDFKVEHIKSPVVQSDDYYPFGSVFNSYSRENTVQNKRLYQSKEYQDDLNVNLYNFEWRQYDPWSVRTTTMDPHAEKYVTQSPYSWSANNPVKFIDPDGRDYYLNLYSGRVEYIEGSKDHFDRAYVHLTGDDATVGDIQDALSSRGYNYALNGNVPGGYQVDTRTQYKGWIMMQTFSEENVGAIMWLGGNAWAKGLPTSKAVGRAVSVWGMNSGQRGMMIERALGGNLPTNFPVIDKLAKGVATSIKSIDLTAKSYQRNGALLGTLRDTLIR